MAVDNFNDDNNNSIADMRTLGACLIVKNEEKHIGTCLASLKGVDEIVILDTGSTDDTVEICREYTDKVFIDYKWRDDFSEARNEAMSRCTADFLIIIDADETLVTPVAKIKKIINEFWFRKYFGMTFTVQMKFETFDAPRLFKNQPEIFYINPAHNVPTWRGDSGELQKRLYQSSFIIDSGYSDTHFVDVDRTFRILSKHLETHPDDTRTLYYLGREYLNRKDIKEAVKIFEKYRDLKLKSCDLWDNELSDVMYLLALCYADEEAWGEVRWYESVDAALWSWSILPTSKDTANFLSKLFSDMPGSVDGAVRSQMLTVKFWEKAREEATDQGTLMRRSAIC